MPKYKVEAESQARAFVIVEAEDSEEARDIALEMIEDGDSAVDFMDDSLWAVVGTPIEEANDE